MRAFAKFYHNFFLCLLFALTSFAQSTGKVIEQKIIKSSILAKDVRYTIYLPAD
ncbi:MAG: hypothetical protein ACHQET_06800 [Chitinophagales bacterium]